MKRNISTLAATLAIVVLVARSGSALAEPQLDYVHPEMGDVSMDSDLNNGRYKKCQIVVSLVNIPESVALGVKVLTDGNVVLSSFTVDVGAFNSISTGIVYDYQRKPITSARILANIFDSDKVTRRVDMGDGGLGYSFNDPLEVLSLLQLIKRGDYYLTFKRADKSSITTYAVSQRVSDKIIQSHDKCVRQLSSKQ